MTSSPRVTLIVPDIGSSLRPTGDLAMAEGLARLAGRGSLQLSWPGRDRQAPLRPWQRGLLDALDISANALTSAPLSAAGHGMAAHDGYWLHAEPVHFAAGLDQVTFIQLEGEARMTFAEHAALTQTLAKHFPADEFTLHPAGEQWFIHSARSLQVSTATPEAAAASDLKSMMPRGADGASLGRLMTELQMLLHEHPVNDARAARGLPAINALWLWGGGVLPGIEPRALPVAFGADPFLAGVYRSHGQAAKDLPENADQLAAAMGERVLAVVPATAAISSLESQWITPLTRMLNEGRIGGLDLILDQWQVRADRATRWRFWRRSLPPGQWGQDS